jgi:hypothetical protein
MIDQNLESPKGTTSDKRRTEVRGNERIKYRSPVGMTYKPL